MAIFVLQKVILKRKSFSSNSSSITFDMVANLRDGVYFLFAKSAVFVKAYFWLPLARKKLIAEKSKEGLLHFWQPCRSPNNEL